MMNTSGQSSESVSASCDDNKSGSGTKESGEWTSSKKIINHKTRQVETRIQRQIIMEDGKVIADSGPQITTRTKEDNWIEESENCAKKNVPALECGISNSGGILVPRDEIISEKIKTHNTTREAKQEKLEYHDETISELSGYDIHRKALVSPNDLITINSSPVEIDGPVRGKLTHYSSKCEKVADKEEVKEISKIDPNGNITKETVRTHHHEEINDDEKPETQDGIGTLPEASAETTRKIEYTQDCKPAVRKVHIPPRISPSYEIEGKADHTNKWVESHFGSDTSVSYENGQHNGFTKDKLQSRPNGTTKMTPNGSVVDRRGRPRQRLDPMMSQSLDESQFTSNGVGKINGFHHHRHRDDSMSSSYHYGNHSSGSCSSPGIHGNNDQANGSRHRSNGRMNGHALRQLNGNVVIRVRRKVPKEDASVQASLSDEDSDLENMNGSESRSTSDSIDGPIRMNGRHKPLKTYYFGEDLLQNGSASRADKNNNYSRSEDQLEDRRKAINSRIIPIDHVQTLPRSNGVKSGQTETGRIDATLSRQYRSSINNRIIDDSSSHERFSRSFNGLDERLDGERSLDRLMDRSRTDLFQTRDYGKLSNWRSASNLLSNGSKSFENGHSMTKDDLYAQSKENLTSNTITRSNLTRNHIGSVNSLKSRYRSNESRSYLPSSFSPDNRGLSPIRENRLRNRKRFDLLLSSAQAKDDSTKWPEFSPLTSPTEIQNVSNLFNRDTLSSKHRDFSAYDYKSRCYDTHRDNFSPY